MSEAGEIVTIWIKRARGLPMDSVESATLIAGRGIEGNADQGGRRQVTLLDEEAWHRATSEVGAEVDPSVRRANVLVRGIDFDQSRGRNLLVGRTLIRIFGETRPCQILDEAQPGLRDALKPEWRAGAFGEILEGGTIRVGDPVEWVEGA